jgi:hypothetical protein
MALKVPEWWAWAVLLLLLVNALAAQVQIVLLWRDMRWMRAQLAVWGFMGPGNRPRVNPWPPKTTSGSG